MIRMWPKLPEAFLNGLCCLCLVVEPAVFMMTVCDRVRLMFSCYI